MNYKEIELEVKKILAEQLNSNINNIDLNQNLVSDLSMDSFNSIEVVFELEEKFGIQIEDAKIVKAKTVKDIVDYVATQLTAKGNNQKK